MSVVVMSDTHVMGPGKELPEKLIAELRQAELILHAGDIAIPELLEELRRYAPVYAVHGNVDVVELQWELPERLTVEVLGRPVGLIHGHSGRGHSTLAKAQNAFIDGEVDVVIFGHSHMPFRGYVGDTLLFNPGSPTDRRASPRFAFGRLVLREDGRVTAGHVWL
jgi:putative phosphoesterase